MRVPSVVFGKMSLFVENVIARFFFNLTHVVTRSVSLILLKSGFVARPLKHSIGFRKMCLAFAENVSAVTVIRV